MPNLLGAENVIAMFPYFTVGFVVLILGKFVFQMSTSYDIDDELTEKDNPAMGILLGAYLLGLGIALSSMINGQSTADLEGLKAGFLTIGGFGVLSIILLRLSVVIMDKLILHKFNVHTEITRDRNIGVAFVTGGACVATGLMIAGVMSGSSDSAIMAVRDMLVYWALGQVILVVVSKAFQALTKYDDQKLLEGSDKAGEMQNIPIGVMWAGLLIAQGLIVKAALTEASSDLAKECVGTVVAAAVGFILFAVIRVVTDKFLLPKSELAKEISEDHNPAAGIVCGVAFIAIALMLSPAVNPAQNSLPSMAQIAEQEARANAALELAAEFEGAADDPTEVADEAPSLETEKTEADEQE